MAVQPLGKKAHQLCEYPLLFLLKLVKSFDELSGYDNIIEILNELKEYTKEHFTDEEEYMEGIQYLTIAHRLSSIRNSDRILVLTEEGIVEEGNHDKLMALEGIHALPPP